MKLRNKKTEKIVKVVGYVKTGDDRMFFRFEDDNGTYKKEYNSLAELNEEWEDYEEPNYFYCISIDGSINKYEVERYTHESWCKNGAKIIGNYFETKEEAEKAVGKLKAWKRLKDKGFRFTGWNGTMTGRGIEYEAGKYYAKWVDDMNLIFEDEE